MRSSGHGVLPVLWEFTWGQVCSPVKEAYSGFLLGSGVPRVLGGAPSRGWGTAVAPWAKEPQKPHYAIVRTVFTAFIAVKEPISLKKCLKDARKLLSLSLVMGCRHEGGPAQEHCSGGPVALQLACDQKPRPPTPTPGPMHPLSTGIPISFLEEKRCSGFILKPAKSYLSTSYIPHALTTLDPAITTVSMTHSYVSVSCIESLHHKTP